MDPCSAIYGGLWSFGLDGTPCSEVRDEDWENPYSVGEESTATQLLAGAMVLATLHLI